mmetsp:Transcript_28064/g.95661  ORF Transcript_28064/g.95661 Transcript_28064/m.95661 type:complete len:100 (+) Transcript_28064:1300-1599(+)
MLMRGSDEARWVANWSVLAQAVASVALAKANVVRPTGRKALDADRAATLLKEDDERLIRGSVDGEPRERLNSGSSVFAVRSSSMETIAPPNCCTILVII